MVSNSALSQKFGLLIKDYWQILICSKYINGCITLNLNLFWKVPQLPDKVTRTPQWLLVKIRNFDKTHMEITRTKASDEVILQISVLGGKVSWKIAEVYVGYCLKGCSKSVIPSFSQIVPDSLPIFT